MPDLLAGTTVLAQDSPPAQRTYDGTTATGLTNDTYTTDPGSLDAVSVTFMAPTTGRVELTIWVGMRAGGASERAQASVEVREDDSSGTVVHDFNARNGNPLVGTSTGETSYMYAGATEQVSGLTPGATYWAAVGTRRNGGTDYDVVERTITSKPLP